jgi:aromatic ring hydroxylase
VRCRLSRGLRDGRVIFIAASASTTSQRIRDFSNAARSYAAIFDARFDERYRHILVSEEGGEPCATYFVRPRSRADLAGEPARAK